MHVGKYVTYISKYVYAYVFSDNAINPVQKFISKLISQVYVWTGDKFKCFVIKFLLKNNKTLMIWISEGFPLIGQMYHIF